MALSKSSRLLGSMGFVWMVGVVYSSGLYVSWQSSPKGLTCLLLFMVTCFQKKKNQNYLVCNFVVFVAD